MLLFASCKKNEANTDAEPTSPPEVIAPSYSFSRFDANGLFKVQRTYAYWNDPLNGLTENLTKEATASFKLSPFDTAWVSVGILSCQLRQLVLQSNNTYLLNGGAASALGFSDTLGVNWDATGNPALAIPAFGTNTSRPMPIYAGVGNNSMPSTITRTLGFQIPLGANVGNADSIFISLTVGQKSVVKTIGGQASYGEFSITELSGLPASSGKSALLQVSPINFDVSLAGSKKVYYANQSSYTNFVEVK